MTEKDNDVSAPKTEQPVAAQALSLSQLVGAPIHALIDAETHAALSTANFIRTLGFEGAPKNEEGGSLGHLRMASFRHNHKNNSGDEVTTQVDVPLISLLPIPTLQIRDAELEYTVKILSTETEAPQKRQMMDNLELQTSELVDNPIVMRASLANEGASKRRSLDMLLKMKVNVEQSDIPAGLAKFLSYASESMQSQELPNDPELEAQAMLGDKDRD